MRETRRNPTYRLHQLPIETFKNQIVMPAGRPTIFSEEIIEKTKAYIDACEDEDATYISQESEKYKMYKPKLKVKLPSIDGLAYHLGIHKDTIYQWEEIHTQFSDLINMLRNKQAERLINMGLSGDYNPYIAKALLAKHGYADKQEIDQTVKGSISFKDAQ